MSRPAQNNASKSDLTVPVDTPAWITGELIKDTLRTWRPYYDQPLTQMDAIEILMNIGRLSDFLLETDDEAFRGTGESFESRTGA